MLSHEFEAFGSVINVSLETDTPSNTNSWFLEIENMAKSFDGLYSRFKETSLVTQISKQAGVYEVPHEFVQMLRLYFTAYEATEGAVTPLVAATLEDLGYDKNYSFRERERIRLPRPLPEMLAILDDTHIQVGYDALFDLGALGKGFFADRVAEKLSSWGLDEYLINASGDFIIKLDTPARIGLESPWSHDEVIGVVTLSGGAFCSSSPRVRRWKEHHHVIDGRDGKEATTVLATWAKAKDCATSDLLATCLFFSPPLHLATYFDFEFVVLKEDKSVDYSPTLSIELF